MVGTLLLLACDHEAPEPARVEPLQPVAVRVETLWMRQQTTTYETVGTVRAHNAAAVSSKILSQIQAIHVEEGDQVRKDQLLVELDDRDLRSNLRRAEAAKTEALSAIQETSHATASAQAQLELAEVTHGRYQQLLEKNSVSQHEYDEVSARRRSARANVETTQARRSQAEAKLAQAEEAIASATVALGYARIHAPFSGVVTERRLDPGSLATPGAPILMIDQQGGYRLEAAVPESRLNTIRLGQQVRVVIESLHETLEGKVSEIVPSVDPSSRTFTVKIALPKLPGFRSGLFGRAVFPGEEREVLTVPAAAVIERGQLQSLFVVEAGTARLRLVSLGAVKEGRYEVLSGLRAGEKIVLEPGSLADGSPVRVTEAGAARELPPGSRQPGRA